MQEDQRSVDELIADHRPGYALEQRFYTDPAIYERELRRVVFRNWIVAGHVAELPEPGDFKVFRVAHESAIIVRGADGDLRAFANVCRHRGSLLCLEERGRLDRFACPYHGWQYALDGQLIAARDMPAGFDKSAYTLRRVSFDTVHGLMLVSFSDEPPSLEGCRKDLAGPMAMFDFPNLKVAAHEVYDIPANWKLCIENYQECYHCATAHPDYARMHTLTLTYEQRMRLREELKQRMPACGVDVFEIDRIDTAAEPGEMGYGYNRSSLFRKYKTGSRDGEPVAPLLGNFTGYDQGASDFSFGGFSFLLAYSDHVVVYVFTPVEHQASRCDIYWLVRGDAEEGKDYDVAELTWLWDVTTRADKEIIVNNSKGVHSKYYEPGPFSNMEAMEQRYVDWILHELRRL